MPLYKKNRCVAIPEACLEFLRNSYIKYVAEFYSEKRRVALLQTDVCYIDILLFFILLIFVLEIIRSH